MDIFSFIVAVLPVFLIGLFIYKKDSIKEPSKLLFMLFMFGVLSCFPAAYIGSILSFFLPEEEYMNFIELFIYVFVIVAFVEELCKWYATYKISYDHNEFDTSYDMIVYAVFVALGFACFENILYVSSTGIMIGILRALLAVPGHACDGIIMGVYLGMAKISDVKGNNNESYKYKLLSILVPVITHGIYDYCLFVGNTLFVIIFVIFVIVVDIICFKKVKYISMNSIRFKYKNNYCIGCGAPVISNYCPRCGNKNI